MTTNDRALEPVAEPSRNVVSIDELRQRELAGLIEDQRIDMLTETEDDDESPPLLSSTTAWEREERRYRSAGRRRSSIL